MTAVSSRKFISHGGTNSHQPILQFFEETDPVKKHLREKEMMSLTVRSINTPATTVGGLGVGGKNTARKPMKGKGPGYDIFAMGGRDGSMPPLTDSASFQTF